MIIGLHFFIKNCISSTNKARYPEAIQPDPNPNTLIYIYGKASKPGVCVCVCVHPCFASPGEVKQPRGAEFLTLHTSVCLPKERGGKS